MKMPLVLVEDGDVSLFMSVEALEQWVESPDIESYRVFAADGQVLKLQGNDADNGRGLVFVPVGRVRVVCLSPPTHDIEGLSKILTRYLQLPGCSVSGLSLDLLIHQVETRLVR